MPGAMPGVVGAGNVTQPRSARPRERYVAHWPPRPRLRYTGAMDTPTPISSAAAAEGWAIGLLRELADTLEALPRAQKADALRLLVPTLAEVERTGSLLG